MVRSFSFKKGWNQLRHGDIEQARNKLMDALGLTSTPPFYQRLNGKVEPKVTEAEAIERIFAEYGITEVWGEA